MEHDYPVDGLVYLATAYTKYPAGFEAAYEEAVRIADFLIEQGVTAFSPIAYCHDFAERYEKARDHLFWAEFNKQMLLSSEGGMIVAMMDTWRESAGIAWEIDLMRNEYNRPIYYLDPKSMVLFDEDPGN